MTDACLDAETVAAWIDHGLSGAALEMAQSHVADCGRCQALVGTLARINAVVPPVAPQRDSRRWVAWLVPLTAAAAAVALWVAVPRDKSDRLPLAPEVRREAAQTMAPEPATPDDRAQAAASGAVRGNKQEQAATKHAGSSSRPQAQAPELRRDAGRFEITPSAAAGPAPAPSAAPIALPPAGAKVMGLARNADSVFQAAGIEIVSPDPSVRWRIAGSVVQRSTNGGSSWETVSTGTEAELTAGAAPSASVCWVVGRGGVVLVSTDGRSWGRVAFPEATDLSAVQATDARVASVSTPDGRTFNTTDGGVTWIRRPLQEF